MDATEVDRIARVVVILFVSYLLFILYLFFVSLHAVLFTTLALV